MDMLLWKHAAWTAPSRRHRESRCTGAHDGRFGRSRAFPLRSGPDHYIRGRRGGPKQGPIRSVPFLGCLTHLASLFPTTRRCRLRLRQCSLAWSKHHGQRVCFLIGSGRGKIMNAIVAAWIFKERIHNISMMVSIGLLSRMISW